MIGNVVLSAMAWVSTLRSTAVEFVKEDRGQDLVEYAVLVGAIGMVAGLALFAIGADPTDAFGGFADSIMGCIQFDAALCQP